MNINWRTGFIALALMITLPMAPVSALSVAELGFPAIYPTSAQTEEQMTMFALPPVNIQQEMNAGESPIFDFVVKDQAIELMPVEDELSGLLEKELGLELEQALVAGEDDGIFPPDVDIEQPPVSKEHFWTKKKVFIATGVLLTTGLLFGTLAFAFGGSGSGSGSGSGNGGFGFPGDPTKPTITPDPTPTCQDQGNCITPPPPLTCLEEGTCPEDLPTPSCLDEGTCPGTGKDIPHSPEPATFLLFGLGLFLPWLRRKTS